MEKSNPETIMPGLTNSADIMGGISGIKDTLQT
jgi:hypothetical protein